MTKTDEQRLLHTVERHRFQDELRHKATKQGRFDAAMWHLDHPVPGTSMTLNPSDHGASAAAMYAALEAEPLWLRLWRKARLDLKPRQRAVLDALMVDWRSVAAAKIARCSTRTVDRAKTFFKMHFAQCWRAYERDFGSPKMSWFYPKSR